RTTVGDVSASQLEQRVRLLPSVRSCSIDDRRVTVLVDLATDRRNVAAGVAYILADLGIERTVNVLGGTRPAAEVLPAAAPRTVHDAPTVDPVPCDCHRSFGAGALRFVQWLRAALTVRRGGVVEIQRGLGRGLGALFPSTQAGEGDASTTGTAPTERELSV